MQIATAAESDIRPHAKDHRPGLLDNRILLQGEEGTPDNFKLNVSYTREDWYTPRHRHDFDQIRLPLEGEFQYAEGKVLRPGQVAFFPSSVFYGPQLRKKGLLMMLCQLGSADGHGFVSTAQREAVFDKLKAKGTFHDGLYTYVDAQGATHTQDAAEAVREAATGHPVRYPEPRYSDVVIMQTASYHWLDEPATPGVSYKTLGSFTERKTSFGFVRINAGATHIAGMHDTTELLFTVKGAVDAEGKVYGQHTGFRLKANEGPVPIKAQEDTELFRIHLPKF